MNAKMKNIGIVANLKKRGARRWAGEISTRLRKRGVSVFLERSLADALKSRGGKFDLENPDKRLEALIVLGGDGTLISSFRRLGRRNIPILGVKLGGLGFLTEVRTSELAGVLDKLLRGKLRLEKRKTLACRYRRGGKETEEFTAVNDVVIGKGGLARVIQLEVSVDGEYLAEYFADGIIVATPTGSTAYSLSAQGPIVTPETDALLLNPICPHTLTNRPIIIGNRRTVEIKLITAPPDTTLTIDGQVGLPLQPGGVVRVTKGRKTLNLYTDPDSTYFNILRSKLNWGRRSHYHA